MILQNLEVEFKVYSVGKKENRYENGSIFNYSSLTRRSRNWWSDSIVEETNKVICARKIVSELFYTRTQKNLK